MNDKEEKLKKIIKKLIYSNMNHKGINSMALYYGSFEIIIDVEDNESILSIMDRFYNEIKKLEAGEINEEKN